MWSEELHIVFHTVRLKIISPQIIFPQQILAEFFYHAFYDTHFFN